MARFLKVYGYSDGLGTDGNKTVDRWVNIYSIDEIVPIEDTRKKKDGSSETGLFSTRFHVHYDGGGGANYKAEGLAEEWVAKIDALIAADIAGHHPHEEEEDDAVVVRPRGTWTKGEAYKQLDMVDHPTEEGKRYIAVAANTSTSVLILSNAAFWCQLKDVE